MKWRVAWGFLTAFLLVGCAEPPPAPQPARPQAPKPAPVFSSPDAKFAAFIRNFRSDAINAGIRGETYDRSMAGVSRLPRVEELNRKQPEFAKTPWAYLEGTVSPARVETGTALIRQNEAMLDSIEARYGVPKETLVAVWGLESGFGGEMGGFNMFSALATLAYDGPRQEFARRELIAAMKMEEQQHLDPRQMTSSWAGAFGQTQFVPSSFMAHAVDGDGDGRIDLWRSSADALASAAVLLRTGGWQTGQPCYREVTLPKGFPYEQADTDTMQPTSYWRGLGVTTVSGNPLPDSGAGAIYLPAGWRGPAFMAYGNFKAVLTYNNAATYALAICNLADRFRGRGAILAKWPRDERPLTSAERVALQTDLSRLGYDPGNLDGVLGRKVRAALRRYQKDHGIPADGYPNVEMLGRLNDDIRSRAS